MYAPIRRYVLILRRLAPDGPARVGALLALTATLLSPDCRADRLQIPLTLDHAFIESVLREQVFTGPGDSVRLNDDGSGCQYLDLRQPRVHTSDGHIVIRTVAQARAGRAMGGRCLLLVNWNGQLELVQDPAVADAGRSVILRTSSWRALRADGSPDDLSTTIGRWLEQLLPVDLEQTRVSLAEPLDQLRGFLALTMAPQPGTEALLDSLAIDGVVADDDRVRVTLGLQVPRGPPAPQRAEPAPQRAEPALSAAELARLEGTLNAVDAFFTSLVKAVAPDTGDSAALLDVLIGLRRELVDILGGQGRGAQDSARTLFVHAWDALGATLRGAAERQTDRGDLMRYLTFIGAGDALRALDALGPAAGVEISSDGLRRLARILLPDAADDPLRHDEVIDPELRRSLGFGPALAPPQHYEDTTWLDWLIPRAVAAESLDPALVKRLNNWVPRTPDMAVYLPMVRDVLRHVIEEQLRASELDGTFRPPFRSLVFAAAWQESCWRQFVAKDDKRVPMQSASGDLGMMQVNPTVWRGFYDLQGLRWDIVYNARAGTDILEHLMIDYAIRHREHEVAGSLDDVARSTYAVYNGGPRAYDRYRSPDASARGRKVDALFYEKYREIESGKELAVTACYDG